MNPFDCPPAEMLGRDAGQSSGRTDASIRWCLYSGGHNWWIYWLNEIDTTEENLQDFC